MPQPFPSGTVFDPATGVAISGRPTERLVVGTDAGPGKRVEWSAVASSDPAARSVCRCANCGGPNDLSAAACEWCRADFGRGRHTEPCNAQKAPLKVFQG